MLRDRSAQDIERALLSTCVCQLIEFRRVQYSIKNNFESLLEP